MRDINGKAVIPNEYEEIVQISEKYFQTTKDKRLGLRI